MIAPERSDFLGSNSSGYNLLGRSNIFFPIAQEEYNIILFFHICLIFFRPDHLHYYVLARFNLMILEIQAGCFRLKIRINNLNFVSSYNPERYIITI